MTRSPALSDASYWPLSSSAKVGVGTKKTTGPHDHSTTAALCRCHVIDMPSTGVNEKLAGRAIRKVGLTERVTGIEPALSAWESERSGLPRGLTCESKCPRVIVGNRLSPRLMAR